MKTLRTLVALATGLCGRKRIKLLVLTAAVGLLSSLSARAADTTEKYTYVIVHGATAGGWEWKRTGKFLSDDGHTVYRATLTGLGERMHLNSPEIDLKTHIDDVVNLILFEDLHDVVLTGHSYGGMVITGVMDRVPERIRHVVFLDAAVPEDGMSLWDLFGGRGPADPTRFADGFMQVPWVKADTPPPHNVKQSIKCFNQPVSYKNPASLKLPVTYVAFVPKDKSAEERAKTDKSWQRAVARGWTIRTFPGGHVAQQEDPRGVATLMEEAVGDVNRPVGAAGKSDAKTTRENPRVYRPDFASLEEAEPAPEWFKDAKFGIYFHWGVYSVPAFGNEWYPRNIYFEGSTENRHHVESYGDVSAWPYGAFATGARDRHGRFVQFAPKLKSAGGNFDPEEWAQLFADAGARFAGPVAEHHDGFSMWASRVNPWNAKDMGPRLDLVGLLTDAIRRRGMKTLVSMHHAYNITGFYEAAPKTDDPKLKILYGQQSKDANEALWLAKHKEVIDDYRPDLIWQDFNLHRISEPVLLQFLSYYYNRAAEWGNEVVATYKDGLNPRCAVLDYERGGPPDIKEDYWLTDDAISSTSWSYTEGIRYYSQKQVLHGFIDRISKNGNLLLNISPQADGTIPREQKDLLLAMGAWLRKYGEAVYGTRAWERYGEGPTRMGAAHGVMGPPSEGTARDVRYTRSKDNSTLYAILLGWDTGQKGITLEALSSDRIDGSRLRSVALINGRAGAYLPLAFEQGVKGLHLRLPERTLDELAYVIRLTFDGGIPPYDNFTVFDGALHYHLVPGEGRGDLVVGSELALTRQRKDAANQWKPEPVGHGVHRLLNRADPTLALTRSTERHGVTLAALTGDEGQDWRIADARAGVLTISSSQDRSLALALPAGATAGARVGLAQAGTPSASSRWSLLAVCEQKQAPYKAHPLPGTVEAEDYDVGCPGDAYQDRDDINEGGLYRPGLGVDIGDCSAGGYTLGWTHAGEWAAYTVSSAKTGRYRVALHVASGMDGAALHLESDGADLTGRIDIPNTRGFQNWVVVERSVELSAGEHVLKVHIDGDYVNLDRIVFEATQ